MEVSCQGLRRRQRFPSDPRRHAAAGLVPLRRRWFINKSLLSDEERASKIVTGRKSEAARKRRGRGRVLDRLSPQINEEDAI